MSEQVFIQVRFSENTDKGEYCDALYFTESEYSKLSKSDIDTIKLERVNNWKKYIDDASKVVESEPTKTELEEKKVYIENQIAELQNQVSAISSKILSASKTTEKVAEQKV